MGAQSPGAVEYTNCISPDTKQSGGKVPVMLELWGIQSTPLLPSLAGSLCPWVVAPQRILSMSEIELYCVLMLNWTVGNKTAWLNWIAWNRNVFWQLNCVLILDRIVWHRTDYLYKNGFDVK